MKTKCRKWQLLLALIALFSGLLTSLTLFVLLLRLRSVDCRIVQQLQLIVPGMFVKIRRVRGRTRIGVRHVQMLVVSSKALVCFHG